MKILNSRQFAVLFMLLIMACTYFVYQRGLSGTFIFDDGPAITMNPHIAIQDLGPGTLLQAVLSSASGTLGRPISMLSFTLNYYFTGLDPFYFKLTNLAIHLGNGIGIFILTSLLLSIYQQRFQPALSSGFIRWVGVAIAAAWMLHPFNLTSVLYVVQRMTSLSALFSIWGLAIYLWGRIQIDEEKYRGIALIFTSLIVFTPLAVLSKENGVLLPLLMLVAEISLFNFQTKQIATRRFLIGFFVVTVAIPIVVAIVYLAVNPEYVLANYTAREFTLTERLMTEARVIWFYIHMIILPSIAQMGLFHDDIINSRSLFQPATTLFSIIGIAGLLSLAILVRKKAPLITFGLLFFFVGHSLESSIFALDIAYEHRNYLPMYGVLLILFFYLLSPLYSAKTLLLRQITCILLIAIFAFSTHARAGYWSNPFDFAESEVAHHPNSARNNGEMAGIYANIKSNNSVNMEINYMTARYHYEKATNLDPAYTNGLFGLIILSSSRNKPVEQFWITELKDRLEQTIFSPEKSTQLMGLVNCQVNGICNLAKSDIEGLLRATLNNPSVTGINRANVLSALVLFQVNIAKEYSTAVKTIYQAIEAAPDEHEHRLTLIKFLMALGRNEEAKEQLIFLRSLDKFQVHAKEIQLQSKLLSEIQ